VKALRFTLFHAGMDHDELRGPARQRFPGLEGGANRSHFGASFRVGQGRSGLP